MDFKDCIRKRIAKEVSEDRELIASLLKTSKNKLASADKLELSEVTSNSKISLVYDSLRELLEALAIKKGFKIYNHECYTPFLKEILRESIKGDEFDELRKIRNSVNYYAKDVSVSEAKDILERLKKLREEIMTMILKKKRLFIVHRWDGTPKSDWYSSLKAGLENKGFKVDIPKMPNTSEPKISSWAAHLKRVVKELDNETYFIGHSIGAQAIMRFLEKEDCAGKVGKIIFVAGWFKLDNLEGEEVKAIAAPWLKTPIDLAEVRRKISSITVFLSANEPYGFVEENRKEFQEKLGAKVILEKNKGHFTEDDGVTDMPEILDEIK